MTVVTPKDTPATGERRGAVFLDRDQTLNVDHGYTHLIEDFAWITGAPEALALFARHGIACFIVTNQGGIGRGFYTSGRCRISTIISRPPPKRPADASSILPGARTTRLPSVTR